VHPADPLGSLTPAEVPLIEAEKLSEQAGPPQSAYGFNHDSIAGLVLEGFATVVPDMARIGEQTIDVELVMITDAGQAST
jgi:hypothetical protein